MTFDHKRLLELKELGGDEFVVELWRAFLDICAFEIPKLESALKNGRHSDCQFIAHQLRSASGNVGASALNEICTTIEVSARSGNKNSTALVTDLLTVYKATLACEPASKAA